MGRFDIDLTGGVNPAELLQGFMEDREARKEKEETEKAIRGASKGDPEALETLFTLNPKAGQFFDERHQKNIANDNEVIAQKKKLAEIEWGLKWASAKDDTRREELEQEAINNPLVDFDENDLGFGTEQANILVNAMLFKSMGKENYNAAFKKGSTGEVGTDQRKFDHLLKVAQDPSSSELEVKAAKVALRTIAPAGISKEERIALDDNLTKRITDSQAKIKGGVEFAKMDAKSRSKFLDSTIEKLDVMDEVNSDIDRAVFLVEQDGARSGVVQSQFPSITAATVELEQIRKKFALSIVALGKFGQLSEGELRVAMAVGMPDLEPEALVEWLKLKRSGNEKMKEVLLDATAFVSGGGSVAQWKLMQERGSGKEKSGAQFTEREGDVLRAAMDQANDRGNLDDKQWQELQDLRQEFKNDP